MAFVRDGRGDIADRIRETAQDFVKLIGAQLRFMRVELLTDARVLGTHLVRFFAFAPLVLFGYGFLMVAIALGLARVVGLTWSLLLVGSVNLGFGVWGCLAAARALTRVRVLDRTRDELERSVERVTAAATPTRPLDDEP